ncbi:leucyl/phenylalanyl-tRNA--protein transferase [Castellaniella sp. GW247-6E4]|uniref:leucyl/phenylalanyl-tRNA--protein transferase n=1 Tax=Castellaniella sp. GW247-6E4 TaxID=3140380 RepID=UPI0033145FD7
MRLTWIDADTPLPDPSAGLPGGLVAAGLDLSPARLDEAYRKGLFPWYSPGDPVLWWSPDPRMVLSCADLRISHSLAKRVRQFNRDPRAPDAPLRVTTDLAFGEVIRACAQRHDERLGIGAARAGIPWPATPADAGRDATWITPDIIAVYEAWHRMGRAHSVETWIDGRLAGGLYGVSIGRCFFGESMFSRATDASKVALAYLVAHLRRHGVPWIDCQQETPHLARLGAAPVPRARFLARLAALRDEAPPPWPRGRLTMDGTSLDEE